MRIQWTPKRAGFGTSRIGRITKTRYGRAGVSGSIQEAFATDPG
jgi:hypothetical protein